MRRLGAFVWVIVILVSADAGLALFCRSSCGFWQRAYVANDHRVSSEVYHHGLAPNLRVREGWGLIRYRYATNSLGFKDAAPRAVDPGGGAYRVLFLGDSFTEGKGLDYRRSFVGRVARAWGKRGIEVLNAGVDSYSPVIYRLKLKHLVEAKGLRIDLCVVFLDVSDIYDEVRRYRVDSEGRLAVPPGEGDAVGIGRFLRDHSFTARLLPFAWDHLAFLGKAWKRRLRVARDTGNPVLDVDRLDMWIASVTGLMASAWSYDDARWEAYGRAGRARAAANMNGLLTQLERLGVPPCPRRLSMAGSAVSRSESAAPSGILAPLERPAGGPVHQPVPGVHHGRPPRNPRALLYAPGFPLELGRPPAGRPGLPGVLRARPMRRAGIRRKPVKARRAVP